MVVIWNTYPREPRTIFLHTVSSYTNACLQNWIQLFRYHIFPVKFEKCCGEPKQVFFLQQVSWQDDPDIFFYHRMIEIFIFICILLTTFQSQYGDAWWVILARLQL